MLSKKVNIIIIKSCFSVINKNIFYYAMLVMVLYNISFISVWYGQFICILEIHVYMANILIAVLIKTWLSTC